MTKSNHDLVSIVIPVYNAASYLPYCLDSVLNQTYTNLQVILIDDGSSDNSPAICDEYAQGDSRIQVVHQNNLGISAAQNKGLDMSRGQYLAFVDNDDILDTRNIEILLCSLQNTGADMSKARWSQFSTSQIQSIAHIAAAGRRPINRIQIVDKPLKNYQTYFCKTLRLLMDIVSQHGEARYFNEANWCRLYRSELWQGIRFPVGHYAQDVMVAGQLYERMTTVVDVDCVLYYWLQSPSSVTHAERSPAFYRDNIEAGLANFQLALGKGITPLRSFYTICDGLLSEKKIAHKTPQGELFLHQDYDRTKTSFHRLGLFQILTCIIAALIRHAEKLVYDAKIKNMT